MDYDSIPHEDIRHATYKYRVRVKDAQAFKRRMDTEPDFLSELMGLFNSGCSSEKRPPKARIVIGSKNIEEYLLLLRAALPDALPTQQAARLISVNPQRIHEQIRAGTLHGATLGGGNTASSWRLSLTHPAPSASSSPAARCTRLWSKGISGRKRQGITVDRCYHI